MADTYSFSPDAGRLDRERVHHWLSERSYWARGRSRETQDAAIDASRNYGVYSVETGGQVAYARFVADAVRGRGIGKMLAAGVVADLEPLNLKRIMLATADAHGLYAQYGFTPLSDPSQVMVRLQ